MATDLMIHIGAAKAGSSAIQDCILQNKKLLHRNNFIIPDKFLGLSTDITGEHVFSTQKYILKNDKIGLEKKIHSLMESTDSNSTVLLSAENLSNSGCHDYFTTLGRRYNISVIFYIRRQDDLLASAWQQWHSKREHDMFAWLIPSLNIYGQWARIINDWESVIGQDAVSVKIFERDRFPDGNVAKDFLTYLGVTDLEKANFNTGETNPSYSDIITSLVSGGTNLFKDANDNEFYKIIGSLTGDTYTKGKKVSLFTPIQRAKILQFYQPINESVRQKYFPEQESLFKPIEHAKYRYINQQDQLKEQLLFLTDLVYRLALRVEKND